jgi:hypothetical protein
VITLTKIKTAGGEETPRFDAVLNWHGAPVALVSNAGHGGACHVLWQAKLNGPPTPLLTRTAVLRAALELAQREEPELFAAASPAAALDYVLVSEVETERLVRSLDRLVKKSVAFRAPGQAPGTYYTTRGPLTPALRAEIHRRHPGATILNDLSPRERAAIVRAS